LLLAIYTIYKMSQLQVRSLIQDYETRSSRRSLSARAAYQKAFPIQNQNNRIAAAISIKNYHTASMDDDVSVASSKMSFSTTDQSLASANTSNLSYSAINRVESNFIEDSPFQAGLAPNYTYDSNLSYSALQELEERSKFGSRDFHSEDSPLRKIILENFSSPTARPVSFLKNHRGIPLVSAPRRLNSANNNSISNYSINTHNNNNNNITTNKNMMKQSSNHSNNSSNNSISNTTMDTDSSNGSKSSCSRPEATQQDCEQPNMTNVSEMTDSSNMSQQKKRMMTMKPLVSLEQQEQSRQLLVQQNKNRSPSPPPASVQSACRAALLSPSFYQQQQTMNQLPYDDFNPVPAVFSGEDDHHSVVSNLTNGENHTMESGLLPPPTVCYSIGSPNQTYHSTGTGRTGGSMKDSEDCFHLQKYFMDTVQCTEAFALQYAAKLMKQGVPTVDVLKRRLLRNENYLLDIGFDEYVAYDIMDLLLGSHNHSGGKNLSTSNNSKQPQLKNHSMYSIKSAESIRSVDLDDSFSPAKQYELTRKMTFGNASGRSFHTSSSPSFYNNSPTNNNSLNNFMLLKSLYDFEESPLEIADLYAKTLNYQNGDNLQQQSVQRLTYLGTQGNPYAIGYLMRIYALGLSGQQKNIMKANELAESVLSWLKKVLEETETIPNNVHAMYCKYLLGVCYSEGLGGLQINMKEAFLWYRLSAEQGYDAAQAVLAACYYEGTGCVKDTVEAFKWYRLAASQGFASAQCNLGICYELGVGCPVKDMFEATKWYKLSAEQGNTVGQYNYATCCELGKGCSVDAFNAVKYYQLAAEQGHFVAQHNLGMMYFNGYANVIEQNHDIAFHWIEKSANLGYYAKAQCSLGICFEKGLGCELNLPMAVKYYTLASEQGDAAALYYLGYCFFYGMGVEAVNHEKAIHYYKLSAEKGHLAAQNNLGYCCYQGIGVRKNYSQALYWYKKSAEQGYAPAQYNLGYCYEKGYGVAKRQKEMLIWYKKAAENGHEKAISSMKRFLQAH
jgi:TPR repeat protein